LVEPGTCVCERAVGRRFARVAGRFVQGRGLVTNAAGRGAHHRQLVLVLARAAGRAALQYAEGGSPPAESEAPGQYYRIDL
jgi:hypothetical protein